MQDEQGWIRLHRKIVNNPLWTERREFSKAEAWIDMIMDARHSETPGRVMIGNMVVVCNRGEIIKSLDTLSRRWNWNKSKVRRFLDSLQSMNQIRHANETKTTRITICNYDTYNPLRHDDDTQVTPERNASETHSTPNKNVIPQECENGRTNSSVPPSLFGNDSVTGSNATVTHNESSTTVQQPLKPKAPSFKTWTAAELMQAVKDSNKDGLLYENEAANFVAYWMERDEKGKPRIAKEKAWGTRLRMQTALKLIYAKHRQQNPSQPGYTVGLKK